MSRATVRIGTAGYAVTVEVYVDLRYVRRDAAEHIDRTPGLHGRLTDEQRARLADIA